MSPSGVHAPVARPSCGEGTASAWSAKSVSGLTEAKGYGGITESGVPMPDGAPVLLPCPFCGGDGIPDKTLRKGRSIAEAEAFAHFIVCRSCATQGPWYKTPGNAARSWNMRAGAQPAGEREAGP